MDHGNEAKSCSDVSCFKRTNKKKATVILCLFTRIAEILKYKSIPVFKFLALIFR